MRTSRITIISGAAFAMTFAGAVIAGPADAAPVAPNGSFSFSWLAGNTVDTGNYSERDDLAFA
jgi:hypothetical protein